MVSFLQVVVIDTVLTIQSLYVLGGERQRKNAYNVSLGHPAPLSQSVFFFTGSL